MKPISLQTLLLNVLLMLCTHAQAGVEITYIHNDALGSPVAGTDEQGAVRWRSYYQPYGEETLGERQLQAESTGFTGHREDADTGLVYMGARFYSPTLGRFMGIDPAGVNEANIHSFNRYAYANNNPYKYVDPDGESPLDLIFLAADAVKLASAINSGVGIQAAAGDFAASIVGVLSPVPGTGQAIKATRIASKAAKKGPKLIQENPRNLIPTQSKSDLTGSQVKRLTKSMKKDGFDQAQPVDAWRNPKTGRLEIQDGHHRTEAAKKAGLDKIPVQVWE